MIYTMYDTIVFFKAYDMNVSFIFMQYGYILYTFKFGYVEAALINI